MAKILIVENTPLTALRLQLELENAGYQITEVVATASDAIRSLATQRPDLVLLDFHLNENQNGNTVAAYINQHLQLPIIYLSQYSDAPTLYHIEQTSFYAYLTKPFQPGALLLTIRQALAAQRSLSPSSKISFISEHLEHTMETKEVLWICTKPSTKGLFISTLAQEDQFRVYETLKDFLASRDLSSFIQISSSYILNLDAVTDFIGKDNVAISAQNLPNLRNFQLDEANGNRLFRVGKTYRENVAIWKEQWQRGKN